MAVNRHVLGAHDIGQHLREESLAFGESGRIVSRISGQDVVGEGRCKTPDRRVLVDVRHRHRRQVGPLAHPRAETGHQHRVGTEVIEEVAVDRHVLGAHDIGQHLREESLAFGESGQIVSRISGQDVAGEGRCKAPDRRVLVDVRHRHRRQVGPLAHPRAETGHQHRVGTEVIEEVAVNRHVLGAHDIGQHLREASLAFGESGQIVSRISGQDVVGEGRCETPNRRVLVDVRHRHRRQVGPFAYPAQKRAISIEVGTEVIEEVAVDRNVLGAYDIGQHLREESLAVR